MSKSKILVGKFITIDAYLTSSILIHEITTYTNSAKSKQKSCDLIWLPIMFTHTSTNSHTHTNTCCRKHIPWIMNPFITLWKGHPLYPTGRFNLLCSPATRQYQIQKERSVLVSWSRDTTRIYHLHIHWNHYTTKSYTELQPYTTHCISI